LLANVVEEDKLDRPSYPEKWKRERMLFFVHEWIQDHQTDEDIQPNLSREEVQQWGQKQVGLNGAQALHLFKESVEEGYIKLAMPLGRPVQRYPWLVAVPQSLTKKGLMEIGELPNPEQELLRALRETKQRVLDDPNIPEPQRGAWIEWLDRGVTLLDTGTKLADLLSKQLPSGG
jgi:hypothetical protein